MWGATSNATSLDHSRQTPISLKVITPVAASTDILNVANNRQKNTESSEEYSTPSGSSEANYLSLKPPSAVKKSLRLSSRIGKK